MFYFILDMRNIQMIQTRDSGLKLLYSNTKNINAIMYNKINNEPCEKAQ